MSLHNNLGSWERFYCKHLSSCPISELLWVEFCLSPHVFFISQKECLITHLHESCCLVAPSLAKSHLVAPHWVGQQLLASTRYKESSAPKPGESISRTYFFCQQLDWLPAATPPSFTWLSLVLSMCPTWVAIGISFFLGVRLNWKLCTT